MKVDVVKHLIGEWHLSVNAEIGLTTSNYFEGENSFFFFFLKKCEWWDFENNGDVGPIIFLFYDFFTIKLFLYFIFNSWF